MSIKDEIIDSVYWCPIFRNFHCVTKKFIIINKAKKQNFVYIISSAEKNVMPVEIFLQITEKKKQKNNERHFFKCWESLSRLGFLLLLNRNTLANYMELMWNWIPKVDWGKILPLLIKIALALIATLDVTWEWTQNRMSYLFVLLQKFLMIIHNNSHYILYVHEKNP